MESHYSLFNVCAEVARNSYFHLFKLALIYLFVSCWLAFICPPTHTPHTHIPHKHPPPHTPPLPHTHTHPTYTSHTNTQVLYYNMKDMPDAVFDKVVEIKVLNAKKLIADALIGTFKVAPFHSNLSAFHSNISAFHSNVSVFHSNTYHSKYMCGSPV